MIWPVKPFETVNCDEGLMQIKLTCLDYSLKDACIFLKWTCVSGFLVSELQAARMLEYKAAHPDELQTSAGATELEQRVEEETSHHHAEVRQPLEDRELPDVSVKRSEIWAEFALLLQALDMDTSSQYADVLQEVRPMLKRLALN